jgi:hypothetical protein
MEGPVPIAGGLGSAADAASGNPSKLNCLDRRAILVIHRKISKQIQKAYLKYRNWKYVA